MSRLKIYGIPGSRALRTLWLTEELKAEVGLDYEVVKTHFLEESKTPEYLAINPNGRVPAMDDDGFILFESLAINLYLAKKHACSLSPKDAQEEGLATQWSMWALTELEDSIIALVVRHPNVAMYPPDEAVESQARTTLERPLKVLDAHLAGRDFIASERFMVADLNVAGVLSLSAMIEFDLSAYPNVVKWFGACMSRPAVAAAQAL